MPLVNSGPKLEAWIRRQEQEKLTIFMLQTVKGRPTNEPNIVTYHARQQYTLPKFLANAFINAGVASHPTKKYLQNVSRKQKEHATLYTPTEAGDLFWPS